jgi:hypothetical protein
VTFDTSGTDGDGEQAATSNTRRRFMVGSAGAIGGLALGSAFSTGAFADDESEDDAPPESNPSAGEFDDDVDVLNYALTLEHLEAEFYKEAFDNLGAGDFQNSDTLEPFEGKVRDRVVGDLAKIRDHEVTHAETLVTVIEDLGGEPIEKPEFDFGGATEDADAFFATARDLENTGVSAYNGAIGSVESADLQAAGASIATVEGRHASFLNLLNGYPGFPRAFDRARSRSEVEEIAANFIVEEDENEDDDGDGDAGDSDGSKDKDDEDEEHDD